MGLRADTAILVGLSLCFAEACSGSHSHGSSSGKTSAPAPSATNTPAAAPEPTVALDECGLKTQWQGDKYCINPPPADKGFQLRYGPSDYNNPEPKYIMQPGDETVENLPTTSGNASDIYYYFRQYRMRPGSHHLIIYANTGGALGRRLGGTQNLAKDNPEGGVIAPENQGVGMPLGANTPITLNLHYLNYTNAPILKEIWVNFWYRDPNDVTQPANEIFSPTPMNVPPGEHVIIHGSCPVHSDGHALNLYGHRHANNLRFSIWRERGSQQDLVYEDYDWEDPLALEYSSLITNTPANPANMIGGGWSGVLDLHDGDNLSFECDIMNNTNSTFVGKNEAKNDEMCIMVGDSVGSTVPFQCTTTTTQIQ